MPDDAVTTGPSSLSEETRHRCWDCKRRNRTMQVPLRVRFEDGAWQATLADRLVCELHGYNNPYPLRQCPDFVSVPPAQREPLPHEERARWARPGGSVDVFSR